MEHLIPEALGGLLTCEFICQRCNSTFGASFEAKARSDPSVRIAIGKLHAQIPNLARKLNDHQEFYTAGVGPSSRGYIRGGESS